MKEKLCLSANLKNIVSSKRNDTVKDRNTWFHAAKWMATAINRVGIGGEEY